MPKRVRPKPFPGIPKTGYEPILADADRVNRRVSAVLKKLSIKPTPNKNPTLREADEANLRTSLMLENPELVPLLWRRGLKVAPKKRGR